MSYVYPRVRARLAAEVQHYKGVLPERVALAWHGYVGALIEWQLITVPELRELRAMLPVIENNPVDDIMTGRNNYK